jgi:CheY-like chemotaxis protein
MSADTANHAVHLPYLRRFARALTGSQGRVTVPPAALEAAVADHRPGLLLADIHLADHSSGLEAVNEIIARLDIPVVFITAYPEQVLTGARPEPIFLVTKLSRTATVRAVISHAVFFDVRAHAAELPPRKESA